MLLQFGENQLLFLFYFFLKTLKWHFYQSNYLCTLQAKSQTFDEILTFDTSLFSSYFTREVMKIHII